MTDRYTSTPSNQIKDRAVIKDDFDATGETTEKVATVQSNGSVDWQFIRTLADYLKLQDNIMINAFRIAVNGSLTQFNMIDGIVDEYEDETGIDTVNSLNESYNSTDDYYSPTSLATPYAHYKCNDNAASTIVTDDGTGSNNGVANVNSSNYSVVGKINQAFELNGTTEYINLDALEVDIDSDTTGSFSFWIEPDDVLTSGYIFSFGDTDSNTVISVNIASDSKLDVKAFVSGVHQWRIRTVASLSVDTYIHIIVVQDGISPKLYINNVDVTNLTVNTDTTVWFGDITASIDNGRIGCRNSNNIGNNSFFKGEIDDFRYYQNKVLTQNERNEIYNSGSGTEGSGGTQNITLISDTFTAEAAPDTARAVILEEDVDAITLNTDLKAWASRDSGANWVQGTLSDEGDYDASKRILVADFTLTGSGVNMEYKLTSLNNKDFKIHASALNWDG